MLGLSFGLAILNIENTRFMDPILTSMYGVCMVYLATFGLFFSGEIW